VPVVSSADEAKRPVELTERASKALLDQRPKEGASLARQALDEWAKSLTRDDIKAFQFTVSVGGMSLLQTASDYRGLIQFLKRAVDIQETRLGAEDQSLIETLSHLASAYAGGNYPDEKREVERRIARIRERSSATDGSGQKELPASAANAERARIE